jgi:DNA-binding transcriptional regulator YiaG
MRLKIANILPLAFLETLRQILCSEKNDPERLSNLYLRFGSILQRIRKKRRLTIQRLSVLSGVREDRLKEAESGKTQITDNESKGLRDVYWTLATGQASASDYKRIVDQRLSVPCPNFGSSMTRIREEKQINIEELSRISGLPEDILERAEAAQLELTGEDLKDVRRVYWSLAALEASPADYRRLLADISMTANAH